MCTDNKKSIDIKEWGQDGKPLRVFWTPLTLDQQAKINKVAKDDCDRAARVVVLKAIDENGTRLFPESDSRIKLLRNVDGEIVSKIARSILGIMDEEDEEDESGN